MRQVISTLGLTVALMALTTSIAMAAIKFHSGPTFTDNNDGTVTVTGDMSGLGNEPATASLTQTVIASYTCINKGGNKAPGIKPVSYTGPSADQQLSTAKNGRATLNLTTAAISPDATVDGNTAGCPNGNWTGIDPVVISRSALLTITQGGQVIFSETYDF